MITEVFLFCFVLFLAFLKLCTQEDASLISPGEPGPVGMWERDWIEWCLLCYCYDVMKSQGSFQSGQGLSSVIPWLGFWICFGLFIWGSVSFCCPGLPLTPGSSHGSSFSWDYRLTLLCLALWSHDSSMRLGYCINRHLSVFPLFNYYLEKSGARLYSEVAVMTQTSEILSLSAAPSPLHWGHSVQGTHQSFLQITPGRGRFWGPQLWSSF
jgi:hypothetical protein